MPDDLSPANEHERYYLEDRRRLFELLDKVPASVLLSPWKPSVFLGRDALRRRALDGRLGARVEAKGTLICNSWRHGFEMPADADRRDLPGWAEERDFSKRHPEGYCIQFSYSMELPGASIHGVARGMSLAEVLAQLDAKMAEKRLILL